MIITATLFINLARSAAHYTTCVSAPKLKAHRPP